MKLFWNVRDTVTKTISLSLKLLVHFKLIPNYLYPFQNYYEWKEIIYKNEDSSWYCGQAMNSSYFLS